MKNLINAAAKYGSILGLVQIILTLFLYILGTEYMAKFWVSIVIFIVTLVLLIVFARRYRKEVGGYANFKEMFSFSLFSFITMSLVATVFNILLYNVIDPGLPAALKDSVVESTMDMMASFGAPDEAVDEALKGFEGFEDKFSVVELSKQFFWSIVFGAVISLILGASLKKQKDEFSEEV